MKLNNSGYEKTKVKDYDGAFKDFELSLKQNDKYWLAYSNRGASYLIQGNYEKARQDLDKSISLHKKNPDAYDNRGLCKLLQGDSIGALPDFRQALNYKGSYKVYTHLGRLLAELDSCQEALPYLNIAFKKKAFDDCNTEQELMQLRNKCDQKKE